MSSVHSADYQAFLKRFRQARIEAKLSQVQVAGKLRKPQSFVSKCESGERRVDFADYGGGLLLGVDGGIIICHGRSNARAICNAVLKGIAYVRGNVSGSITTALRESVGMLPVEKE